MGSEVQGLGSEGFWTYQSAAKGGVTKGGASFQVHLDPNGGVLNSPGFHHMFSDLGSDAACKLQLYGQDTVALSNVGVGISGEVCKTDQNGPKWLKAVQIGPSRPVLGSSPFNEGISSAIQRLAS